MYSIKLEIPLYIAGEIIYNISPNIIERIIIKLIRETLFEKYDNSAICGISSKVSAII